MNLKKSLQTLKEELSKKETTLKAIQQTHPHLLHLSESQLLTYFEVTTLDELDKYLKHQKKSIETDTKNSPVCNCTDSHGQPKDLYSSEDSAQRAADALAKQKNLYLRVYPCPYLDGWHLTKN